MSYKTILFIDDDQDEHLLVRDELAKKQYHHLSFNFYMSAKLALAHLEEGLIRPEVIILDVNMPLMNGTDFLAEIKKRAHLKAIPVIIHSTGYDDYTRKLCNTLGAVAHLKKGLDHSLLLQTMDAILNKDLL